VSIIDDLLATLDRDAPVREVQIGAFWTAVVLEDGRCGLASALWDYDHQHDGQNQVHGAGHLYERIARELASSDSLLEASMGPAAINVLLNVDEEACRERQSASIMSGISSRPKISLPSP
jgi:uncharacterized protein (DUF4213/DUF364 family)